MAADLSRRSTCDDTLIRIISARDMHPKERKIYEQA